MNLEEILKRIAEIKAELETRGAELSVEDSERLVKEAEELNEQRKALEDAAEKRTALLNSLAAGNTGAEATVVRNFAGEESEDKYGTMSYRRAFMDYVIKGKKLAAEYRADANTKTTDVGAVIPTTVLEQIIEKLENVGGILELVTKTSYKGGVAIPVSSVKPVATWVGEGAGSEKQKLDTSGKVTFAYHKLRCAVSVSLEVDTMSIAAFEKLLINNVVNAMIKALESSIINGTGSGQPKGILAETTDKEVNTTAAAGLSYKTLIDAEGLLPVEYEANAKWCMNKKQFMAFVGMVDSNGQPIARVNYGIAGKPERVLLGREVVLTDNMTAFEDVVVSSSVTKKPYAFLFDFANYVLNTNYALGVKKYEDNDTDDMVTKAIMLVDGKVADKNGLVVLNKLHSA